MFFKIINFFKGKKAYLAGILMIALGAVNNDMQLILEGVAVMALRGGIAKIGNK